MAARCLPALLLLACATVVTSQENCSKGSQCDLDTEESLESNLNLLQVGLTLKHKAAQGLTYEVSEMMALDFASDSVSGWARRRRAPPQPGKGTLILETPHDRYDPSPAFAAEGAWASLLSNLTTQSEAWAGLPAGVALARKRRGEMQAHSFFKGTSSTKSISGDLKALYKRKGSAPAPTTRRRDARGTGDVKSGFLGKAVWRRWDTNEIPNHALLHSATEAVNILKDAPTASETQKTDTSGGQAVFAKLTYSSQKTRMTSVASWLIRKGVNSLSHDVYVSQTIGQNSGGGRRRQVFGPGLNMLWLVFGPRHKKLLGHIVVGANAAADPSAVYPGLGARGWMYATMSFRFTDFSNMKNPIRYFVHFASSGTPALTMIISHYQNKQQYVSVKVNFASPSSSVIPGASGFEHAWRYTNSARDVHTNIFVNKAFQIYEICHCYHADGAKIWNCLMSDGKNDFWSDIMGYMVKWFIDALIKPSNDWTQRPHYKQDAAWIKCWDHTPSPFAAALADAITIINGIVTVVEDAIETAKAVADAVVNTVNDGVDFVSDTAKDVGTALGDVFGIGGRRRKGWLWLQDAANRSYADIITIKSDTLGNEVHHIRYRDSIDEYDSDIEDEEESVDSVEEYGADPEED